MKRVALLLLIALVALCGCSKEQVKPQAKVGGTAPDFVLKDLSGQSVRLSDLRGKVLLVNFWATWCPPCRSEIPSMQKLNTSMTGKPFQMLAISIDEGGKEAIQAYFRQSKTELPALLDSDQEVSRLYGTTGVPETFVVDKRGVIVDKVVGAMEWDDPRVIQTLNEMMAKN